MECQLITEIVLGFIAGIIGALTIIFFDYLSSDSRRKVKEIISCVSELKASKQERKFIRNKYRLAMSVTLDRFISNEYPLLINKPKSNQDKSDRYEFYNMHISSAKNDIFSFHSSFVRQIFKKYKNVLKFTESLNDVISNFDNLRQLEIDNKIELLNYYDESFKPVDSNNELVNQLLESIKTAKKYLNKI